MRVALALLFTVPAIAWADERTTAPQVGTKVWHHASASPLVVNSDQFVVRTYVGGPAANELLDACEQLRKDLQETWIEQTRQIPWRPRCEVVVHASRAGYQQAVGRGSGQTYGSSLIRFSRGQVVVRRIDLLPNAEGRATALPHELAHVVLADRFQGCQPPRWADEGVATLADDCEKRRLHLRDCQYALHAGTAFPLSELLRLEHCSSRDQMAAFYGQSVSLVSFLIECDTPASFLSFVELAADKGYDRALREIYGIDSVTTLQYRWRDFAMAPPKREDTTRLTAFERPNK
jgi:hypothetical protein